MTRSNARIARQDNEPAAGRLEVVGAGPIRIGADLRAARLDKRLTIADAAGALRIGSGQLEAMEQGRFESLPGRAYVIGFLRAYAEFLELDGTELVERLRAEGDSPPSELSFPEPMAPASLPTGRIVAIALAVAALVLAGWWGLQDRVAPYPEQAGPDPVDLTAATTTAPPGQANATTGEETETAARSTATVASVAEPPPDETEALAPAEPLGPEPADAVADVATPTGTASAPAATYTPPAEADADAATADVVTATAATPVEPTATASLPLEAAVVDAAAVATSTVEIRTAAPSSGEATPVEPTAEAATAETSLTEPTASQTATAEATTAGMAMAEPAPVETAAPETTETVATGYVPTVYGRGNEGRIELRATLESWVQITASDGTTVFTRVLRPGDVYRVEDRPGQSLRTGNAGGLEVVVDGVALPPFGAEGEIRRGILLDPERLKAAAGG